MLVVDDRESLVAYFPDATGATAHWSRNVGFIQMTKDYIRHDIWIIKMVQRFEGPITEAYGPDRHLLRTIFTTAAGAAAADTPTQKADADTSAAETDQLVGKGI